jgi:FkbM family methyltransferase
MSPWPPQAGLHELRVWSGPLRGAYIRTPKLSRLSFSTGTYQSHVTKALQAAVKPGMVAYDLGAHIGYFSLVLTRLVGNSGKVFAFEPDPNNLRALRHNLAANRGRNVKVVASVVADGSAPVLFATFHFSSVSHIATKRTPGDANLVEVPSLRLDDFVYRDGNPAPAVIKIDVEGAEARVFEGARRLLDTARPVIVVEVSPRTLSEVERQMSSHGYKSTFLGGDSSRLAATGIGDVLFTP